MSICAKCSSHLEGDFGVITCPGCGEINFLDEAPSPEKNDWQLGPDTTHQNPAPSGLHSFEQVEVPKDSGRTGAEEIQEIADYANSEKSNAIDGFYTYNLFIEGIDSKDLRDTLKDALDDKKFGWDHEQIFRSIQHGKLKIENINAIKVSQLVKKLRGHQLSIRWEQHAIIES